VLHAVRKIEALVAKDVSLSEEVESLKRQLQVNSLRSSLDLTGGNGLPRNRVGRRPRNAPILQSHPNQTSEIRSSRPRGRGGRRRLIGFPGKTWETPSIPCTAGHPRHLASPTG